MSTRWSSRVIVAASVGVIMEALKDQGFSGRNIINDVHYPIRSIHQHANNHFRSYLQANNKLPSSSSPSAKAMAMCKVHRDHEKQSEESLRTVMYLSCWGPN
ncbi:hypothetical protein FNV43_RR13515 [Rhamnella rubrinervis]|uniref:Uncharacterized protein n=1 Tax=Rhamnella rubrinervis TaxID=2594499 RepID=A0A8K0MFB1_9ROSA|nr:hypothetical protein FNV43_RR13515 [Rhamnella rubrinervis]